MSKGCDLTLNAVIPALLVLLAGCSGSEDHDVSRQASGREESQSLEWMESDENSALYVGESEIVRCWKLASQYDCLYAALHDVRSQMADAPVRRGYFRFLTPSLIGQSRALEGLSLQDGYSCDVSQVAGRISVTENIWRDGRTVATNKLTASDWDDELWTPDQVQDLFYLNDISPTRPYFACWILDDLVTKSGLIAIDSPVLDYARVMQADRLSPSQSMDEPSDR